MINRNKLLQALIVLVGIIVVFTGISKLLNTDSQTLKEFAKENPDLAYPSKVSDLEDTVANDSTDYLAENLEESTSKESINEESNAEESNKEEKETENLQNGINSYATSTLTGALLNATIAENQRFTYTDGFYYEPISDNLRRYITGVSYPKDLENPAVSYDELCYIHILHYDFDGNPSEGELICNKLIVDDLLEIFYELYRNEYQLEKVLLIDEYDGDDLASMEDNNTSCFNYRQVEGSNNLSKHAYGLALDINPYYNPYVTYEKDGTEVISPASATAYANRASSFPYRIDQEDLCYKLFTERGFIWGGNWNSLKDYQHFQKTFD
ncbi:M15 family metallopeptidase [Lachnospiraceae bacterium OttesenSCG-928-D06]|nr:M15 family metallopeptidase [Lachnospiraceae bacterium OttesenSCG-928-D06]